MSGFMSYTLGAGCLGSSSIYSPDFSSTPASPAFLPLLNSTVVLGRPLFSYSFSSSPIIPPNALPPIRPPRCQNFFRNFWVFSLLSEIKASSWAISSGVLFLTTYTYGVGSVNPRFFISSSPIYVFKKSSVRVIFPFFFADSDSLENPAATEDVCSFPVSLEYAIALPISSPWDIDAIGVFIRLPDLSIDPGFNPTKFPSTIAKSPLEAFLFTWSPPFVYGSQTRKLSFSLILELILSSYFFACSLAVFITVFEAVLEGLTKAPSMSPRYLTIFPRDPLISPMLNSGLGTFLTAAPLSSILSANHFLI